MLLALTPTGAFGIYAGLNIIVLVMIFLFVPCVFFFFVSRVDARAVENARMLEQLRAIEIAHQEALRILQEARHKGPKRRWGKNGGGSEEGGA